MRIRLVLAGTWFLLLASIPLGAGGSFLAFPNSAAAATIVEARVAASTDDAEQFATGSMYLSSSDLELVHDTDDQTVGMRWVGLAIPKNATISAAYIQFVAKESQSEATTLTFRAQASDNAPTFSISSNISSRTKTSASRSWSPAAWSSGGAGSSQRTADLSVVIQEVVNRGGWASGNALAIIVTGTGHRTAYTFDGSPSQAPLLHVEYSLGTSGDQPPTAVLSVTTAAVPPLTVTADGSGSTDADVTPIATYRFTFGDGTPAVTTTAPSATAQHTYAAAGTYTVSLVATDTGGNASSPAAQSVTLSAPPSGTVDRRVGASSDDAEENSSGIVNLTSSDLELIHDSTDQTVGLRWTNVTVPKNALVTRAYVQFRAKESQSEGTNLTIRGQASDNAATFSSTAFSSRSRTSSSVAWTPGSWSSGSAGSAQRTPELTGVIQEIVTRGGWASGNALALIITGTGHRTGYSFDGSSADAPLLHVEYGGGGQGSSGVAVYAGYYDTHHPANQKPKPSPWMGSSNTIFVGTPDAPGTQEWDTSAIRIDNTSGTTLSGVTVTVDMGSHHFALWGSYSVPAGQRIIFAQTGIENFDGSDTNEAGCFNCAPALCNTNVQSTVPVVHVKIGTKTTDYTDPGQILNTDGVDAAGCPYTGTRKDESSSWVQIFPRTNLTPEAPSSFASPSGPSETSGTVSDARGALRLALSPNPARGFLRVSFRLSTAGNVRLDVLDVAGRVIHNGAEDLMVPGEYVRPFDLSGVAPGVYFFRLSTPDGVKQQSLVLTR